MRESPSPVKGVRFRSLSLRSSWVRIPSPAPKSMLGGRRSACRCPVKHRTAENQRVPRTDRSAYHRRLAPPYTCPASGDRRPSTTAKDAVCHAYQMWCLIKHASLLDRNTGVDYHSCPICPIRCLANSEKTSVDFHARLSFVFTVRPSTYIFVVCRSLLYNRAVMHHILEAFRTDGGLHDYHSPPLPMYGL